MANNNFFKKFGAKIFITLTLICILCFSAFFFVACGDSASSEKKDPTFSYTETNDTKISNASFNYGTLNIDFTSLSSLPRTSVTGWTKSSSTSDINSGVIDVSKEGWETLISRLYDDSDFLPSFKIDKNDIKQEIIDRDNLTTDPTPKQIKEEIIKRYFSDLEDGTANPDNKLVNPGTHSDAVDDIIYMLNNYDKEKLGEGLYQNITSATTLTLEKGKVAKISVWIKTANLQSWLNDNTGAFIAVKNSFNGTSQSQFVVNNINTANDWAEYTLYVKADLMYDTTVSLVLGLGRDSYNAMQGTVYFDDVNYEVIESIPVGLSASTMTYGDVKNDIVVSAGSDKEFAYDMTLNEFVSISDGATDTINNYLKPIDNSNSDVFNGTYTTSSLGVSGNKFGTLVGENKISADNSKPHPADKVDGYKVELDKAGYTVTLRSASFKVEPEQYTYVEFYVKNELSKFGSKTITVDVFEIDSINGEKLKINKKPAIATISEASDDWAKVGLVIKNNFTVGSEYAKTRLFAIDVVIGPVDVSATQNAYDFASGNVTISLPKTATGYSAQYDKDENENENYVMYSLLNSTASGTTSLYAGMQQDSVKDSESQSYSLNYSASDIGAILTRPAVPSDYLGVDANHVYIKHDYEHGNHNLSTDVNNRVNGLSKDGTNYSYAGLVNTKYINTTYADGRLSDLGTYLVKDGEKDVQPLMIYNSTLDNYGFIGSDNTISASSEASVSVKVRVVGDAKAYIYLVETSEKQKDVITFEASKIDENYEDKKLYFEVDSSMMDDDGWATVNFFVATGASSKTFRLEMWNGDRYGTTQSKGYVFFNDVEIFTSGAFSEPDKYSDAFTKSGNPLYDIGSSIKDSAILYTQQLTETEIKFNSEKATASTAISYSPTYVWANNSTNIYAIFNTIDPVVNNPYDNVTEETPTDGSGCTASTDPSAFWLSFSSILLGCVLVLAILMLFIKNFRRKRKKNASDAKSHYVVTSRIKSNKARKEEQIEEIEEEINSEDFEEELVEETENTNEQSEEETPALDEFVYGDVQDFGEENSDKE